MKAAADDPTMASEEFDRATRYLLVSTGGAALASLASIHSVWEKTKLTLAILDLEPWLFGAFALAVASYVLLIFLKASWRGVSIAYGETGLSKRTRFEVGRAMLFFWLWCFVSVGSVATLVWTAFYAVDHLRVAKVQELAVPPTKKG